MIARTGCVIHAQPLADHLLAVAMLRRSGSLIPRMSVGVSTVQLLAAARSLSPRPENAEVDEAAGSGASIVHAGFPPRRHGQS